jgi:hypothetical protein
MHASIQHLADERPTTTDPALRSYALRLGTDAGNPILGRRICG